MISKLYFVERSIIVSNIFHRYCSISTSVKCQSAERSQNLFIECSSLFLQLHQRILSYFVCWVCTVRNSDQHLPQLLLLHFQFGYALYQSFCPRQESCAEPMFPIVG